MTQLTFSELDWRGLSPKLWKGFAPPSGGQFHSTASGNPAMGFFDDFIGYTGGVNLDGTTDVGVPPYYVLSTTGTATVLPVATTLDTSTAAQKLATHLGAVRLLVSSDNDEAALAYGGTASEAMFKLDPAYGFGDLVFECRVLDNILTAADLGWFVGLIEGGGQAAAQCFDVNQDPAGTFDQLGFIKLMADSTGLDTYCNTQAGASNKGTVDVHTLVASQYVKLGFKWESASHKVKFFVDGVEKTAWEINGKTVTAGTFPDDTFMTPIICVGTDQATDMTVDMDWWACAQYLHPVV
ncbi:MAG: hypothetical protein HQ582_15425 [Planctomycetes bacterium]|nr:hypothetical protein [Planctomycetota bacterium]